MTPKHPWLARIVVAIIMLALAFLGLVITDIQSTGGWNYWKWVVPVYAILALWLSWYIQRKTQTVRPVTIAHELLHWIGVMGAVFLVSLLVEQGIVDRMGGGFLDLVLLALGLYLAGIYIETSFLFIGIVLAFFAFFSALVIQYLYAFIIPVFIGGVLVVALTVWLSHKKFGEKHDA